ncbi:Bug family tripartite tricarboxylate transporter substrate binding protein [Achromobacter aloeverae]|uniref:Tripartite tricarboxylate transporter substrate binding protein n=1 Tax=Achromobacter aloeverae TaxID=1750518 RepID=A0A4Q1HJR6_9BURK|nr:tripartite tricarboxylate transporter substrate binding protein [Achromobacter aloeverae]RXN90346.1 hypothetical protein C7R54_12585 [Achromobacter aloeverae]
MITRRKFLSTSAAAAMCTAIRPAVAASSYPDRPIRLVVPYAPGGGSDVLARLVARTVSRRAGSNMIVDNRGGAGGAMGLEMVVRAKPDGYTLVLLSTSHATNGAVMHLNYDVVKDTQAVGQIAQGPWILVVNPQVQVKDLHGFLELARASPGLYNYASSGVGSSTHLASELFAEKASIKVSHVPYRSSGLALTDLLANRVQFMLASAASVAPYLRDGRLKPLCISTASRSALMPDIPTAQEAGVTGFDVTLWHGLSAPAGTPTEVVHFLAARLTEALESPDLRQQFALEGLEPQASTPEQFADMVARDVARWRDIVRTAHIKLE